MTAAMHARLERIRERAAVRLWEYRQRRYAHGVWFRLRRILADAAEAWVIDDADAARLLDAGHAAEPVGRELAPTKTLVFVPRSDISTLPSARRVPIRLREILGATNVALVRFESDSDSVSE